MITSSVGIEETHDATNVKSGVRLPYGTLTRKVNMSKTFTLGEVLTVTTGYLLSNVDSLYSVLNYLTGSELYTHQLPRAADHARPALLEAYPELDVDVPELKTEEEVDSYLNDLLAKGFKNEYELEPVPNFEQIDPLLELVKMMNKE